MTAAVVVQAPQDDALHFGFESAASTSREGRVARDLDPLYLGVSTAPHLMSERSPEWMRRVLGAIAYRRTTCRSMPRHT